MNGENIVNSVRNDRVGQKRYWLKCWRKTAFSHCWLRMIRNEIASIAVLVCFYSYVQHCPWPQMEY